MRGLVKMNSMCFSLTPLTVACTAVAEVGHSQVAAGVVQLIGLNQAGHQLFVQEWLYTKSL